MRRTHPTGWRPVALVVVGVLPWTVVASPGGIELVFLWGLANPATAHVVSLPEYLFVLTSGLPDRLLAWPAGAVLYGCGLLAALADESGRGDVRLTAGLIGLSGLAHLGFALGITARAGASSVPLGPALVALVLWWFYWPALRREYDRER